jgi:hypothetical protein
MSDAQNKSNAGNDEVSLVDIIAVCLRYRKIIIGLPVVATLVAALVFNVLPVIGLNVSKPTYTATVSTVVAKFPNDMQVTIDPAKALAANFASISFVEDQYVKAFPKVAGMSGEALSTLIKKGVVNKQLKFAYDKDSSVGTLSFVGSDKEKVKEFASAVWTLAVAEVMARINGEYDNALAVLKQQIDSYGPSSKLDAATVLAKNSADTQYQRIVSYKNNKAFPFVGDQRVTLTSETPNNNKTLLIIAFAFLFLGIISAFVLNAVRGIKENPEDMAKLKSALSDK